MLAGFRLRLILCHGQPPVQGWECHSTSPGPVRAATALLISNSVVRSSSSEITTTSQPFFLNSCSNRLSFQAQDRTTLRERRRGAGRLPSRSIVLPGSRDIGFARGGKDALARGRGRRRSRLDLHGLVPAGHIAHGLAPAWRRRHSRLAAWCCMRSRGSRLIPSFPPARGLGR